MIISSTSYSNECKTKIISPVNGQKISPPFKLSDNKKVSIEVTVNVDCEMLPDEKVTIFVKAENGSRYWVPGKQVGKNGLSGKKAVFGAVTIGTPDDGKSLYSLTSGITKQKEGGGSKVESLPDDIKGVHSIEILKGE